MMDGLRKFISLRIHLFIQGAFQGPSGSSRPALFLLPVNRCRRHAQGLRSQRCSKDLTPSLQGIQSSSE